MPKALLGYLLFITLIIVSGCREDEVMHDMARFDRAYVPALVLTGTRDTTGRSVLAVKRLRQDWELVSAKYAGIFRGGDTAMRISGIIEKADALVTTGDFEGAHAELERIRGLMMEARKSNGVEYYLDFLTDFHTTMEKMVSVVKDRDPSLMGTQDAEAIARLLPLARAQWKAVSEAPFSRGPFLFSRENEEALMEAVAAEAGAIEDLGAALRSRNMKLISRHTMLMKAGFARVFEMFGNFDSVSI